MSTPPTVHDSDRKAAEAPRMPFPYHTKAEDPHLRVTETFFRETTDLGTPRGGWQTEVYNPLHQVIFVAYGLTKKSSMERAAKLCELFHTQDIIALHHAEERAAVEKMRGVLNDLERLLTTYSRLDSAGSFCMIPQHYVDAALTALRTSSQSPTEGKT